MVYPELNSKEPVQLKCIERERHYIFIYACVCIYDTKGVVILGKHRTDDILAFVIKFPCWREALGAQRLCLGSVAGEAALAQTAWKQWCLGMDCRGFRGQNSASSTKDGFPKELGLHSRRGG